MARLLPGIPVFLGSLHHDDGDELFEAIDNTLSTAVHPTSPSSMSQHGSNAAGPDGCRLFALMQYTCVAHPEIKCWPFERVFRQ